MTCRLGLLGTVASGALLFAGTAQAQLSAENVWNQWRSYSEDMGQSVTVGSESKAGGTLTLQGVVFSMDLPDAGTVQMTIGEMRFAEQPGGRVAISMSDSYPLSVQFPEMAEGDQFELTVSHPGFAMTASGRPGAIEYDFNMPSFTLALNALRAEGQDIPAVARMVASQVSGTYLMSDEGIGSIASQTAVGSMDLVMQFEDPSGFSAVDMTASLSGIRSTARGQGLNLFDGVDMPAALRGGFGMVFDLSSQKSTINFELVEWGDTTAMNVASGESGLRFELSRDTFAYSTTGRNISMSVSGEDIPFPSLDLAATTSDFWVSMPLSATDAPVAADAGLRFENLTLNSEVWDMVDPFGAFPRDPITAIIDIGAQLQLTGNIYDDDTMFAAMMFGPLAVGELAILELRELRLAAIGAELTGDGRFTFDNDDLETFPGMPRPTGSLNLRLLGGNTLLDKLIDMGMIPRDEAMGFRMMLGLFARPGPGPDELTSTLEVREDGAVLANGQRIQ